MAIPTDAELLERAYNQCVELSAERQRVRAVRDRFYRLSRKHKEDTPCAVCQVWGLAWTELDRALNPTKYGLDEGDDTDD